MRLFQTSEGLARQVSDSELGILNIAESSLDEVLANGTLESLAQAAIKSHQPIAKARWLSPVLKPSRFVIAGLNYKAHCEEIGRPVPQKLLFGFAPGSAAHPAEQPILMPTGADTEVDYEGEIGVVISQQASNVSADDAWSVVAGLVPLNDVSARDVQAAGTLEAVGKAKGFDTFKPFGPCLATIDEFENPLDISIKTWVNGELRQEGRSGDMVFSIPKIIEIVTSATALEPGDVICTGTPGGVAHGGAYPYLIPGDTVEIEVEGLPRLVNSLAPD
ncbi:MAG: fumarylacetoacetate hydrolase family protein [Chloroflexota bacterium]